MRLRSVQTALICLLGLLASIAVSSAARRENLALRHVSLDLPGPPAKVIASDLDGDGRQDLVVVVAYTEIEEIGDDRIENMVQISRVIPYLYDRREVRAYLATAEGGYELAGKPLSLPASTLHLEPGPTAAGVIALTDEGVSRLRFEATASGPTLRFEPLIADEPILAHTGSFFASLKLLHELDGDGIADLLLPSKQGLAVYLGSAEGLSTTPASRIELPGSRERSDSLSRRWYPYPTVRDINGDGLPDLQFDDWNAWSGAERVRIYLGSGAGRFRPLRSEALDCHDTLTDLRMATASPGLYPWPDELAAFRDLDGDGRAEAVFTFEQSRGDGLRKELKDAKRPIQQISFHGLKDDLAISTDPYFKTEIIGHTMEIDEEDVEEILPTLLEQFEDLDGDGREDLITITLQFSLWQAVKIMATKKIGIGVDFHVYAQQSDGTFKEVPDLDLHEKLKFNLNNLKLGRFAQFAGDFDGDGRQDFVHLGRGKVVTIHRGQPGCRYPKKPDLSVELDEEPASMDLIKVGDFDGDGRSDLRITRPLPATDVDVTAPVRLDLYLTGGAS
jgi:hypothetical protein